MAETRTPKQIAADKVAELIERLEKAEGPDRELDFWLTVRVFDPSNHSDEELQADIDLVGIDGMHVDAPFTASLDAAVALAERVLPGWSWRVATCCVSDDAWVLPDFNSPEHGDRLRRDFDEATDWTAITDVDLRPPGRPAIALCMAVLLAVRVHMHPRDREEASQ